MYCSYRKVRRRRRNIGKFFAFILVVAIIAALWLYYKTRIVKTVVEYTTYEINSLVTLSVNKAVLLNLNGNTGYDDLIAVEKDNAGNITLLASDAYKMNAIGREISISAQSLMKAECDKGVYIPFGALTGITLIAGFGKEVKLDVLTTESVNCEFASHFESMGINQTRHAVFLEVESVIKLVMPAATKEIKVVTDVLLCEAVIVGKIPEVYLNGGLFGKNV